MAEPKPDTWIRRLLSAAPPWLIAAGVCFGGWQLHEANELHRKQFDAQNKWLANISESLGVLERKQQRIGEALDSPYSDNSLTLRLSQIRRELEALRAGEKPAPPGGKP